MNKRIGKSWKTVWKASFLTKKDYEENDFNKIKDKIGNNWEQFMSTRLKEIEDIFNNKWKL